MTGRPVAGYSRGAPFLPSRGGRPRRRPPPHPRRRAPRHHTHRGDPHDDLQAGQHPGDQVVGSGRTLAGGRAGQDRRDHREHDRSTDLHRGVHQTRRQALLVVGDAGGGLRVDRRERRGEADPEQQHRRQQQGDVAEPRVHPQEQRVRREEGHHPGGDQRLGAHPLQHAVHPRGAGDHQQPGGQEAEGHRQRRPAQRVLEVERDQELEREVAAGHHGARDVGVHQVPGAQDAESHQR